MRFVIDDNGCWNFSGNIGEDGYGKISIKSHTYRAHRLMAHLTIKPMMDNADIVAHTCDNPKCINPDHLFITSPAGNSLDMVKKHRASCGERHPNAKLTGGSVKAIRELYASGHTLSQISPMFNVSDGCIRAIVRMETWRHIT